MSQSINCGKYQGGDRGQRYEVRYFERDGGRERVLGWTNVAAGGALMWSARLMPYARDPWVVDRQAGRTTETNKELETEGRYSGTDAGTLPDS